MPRPQQEPQRVEARVVAIGPRPTNIPDHRAPILRGLESPRPRGGGLFGWGYDPQDSAHENRKRKVLQLAVELHEAEYHGLLLDVTGTKQAADAAGTIEQIVESQEAESFAERLSVDLAGEFAVRARQRHRLLQDIYDAEATDILRRR
jgi:hypothetical protein